MAHYNKDMEEDFLKYLIIDLKHNSLLYQNLQYLLNLCQQFIYNFLFKIKIFWFQNS